MRKFILSAVSGLVLATCAVAPVAADDASAAKSICVAPLSLVAGCAVGTPIAAARHAKKTFSNLMSALSDDNNSYKFWGGQCAIILAVPIGAVKGCFYGPKNSIVNCTSKPFSKDAFSLGEMP